MISTATPPTEQGLVRTLRGPLIIGSIVFALFFGVFGAWAATARIASGAMAPGTISPDGSRRTVQHLEGGIISELKVRDGDLVEAGQPLLVLERTRAEVGDEVLGQRQLALQALIARLQTEQAGRAQIDFPEPIASSIAAEIVELREIQIDVFRNRTDARRARVSALQKQITQLEAEIDGLNSLISSQTVQADLLGSEIATVTQLFNDGLAPEARLLELRRRFAEITGARAENSAKIARSRQSIGQIELEVANYDSELQAEISETLDRARQELATVTTERAASTDILSRTVISAPVPGKIANLQYKTIGGVITPGSAILDIVPTEEDLVIEARVSPIDIDAIRVGMAANVQLTAFTVRTLPQIGGTVRSISADTVLDEVTGEAYFRVSVEVDQEQLAQLEEILDIQLTLAPGMPADVLLVTGDRTLLQYLWEPLGDSVNQAFREE
ncbi:MAG: HlyD family type I secretion periplasmic adaptor subunit [Pseudomonadota bacterium]